MGFDDPAGSRHVADVSAAVTRADSARTAGNREVIGGAVRNSLDEQGGLRHRRRVLLAGALSMALIMSGGDMAVPRPALADTVSTGGYQATIRRTSYGVPHVLASTLGSVTFGQGWAYAEDRFCDLADQIVKVRSERSRWFGPGPDGINLATDFGYRALGLVERARAQEARLSAEERELLAGYVAGFNGFLAANGAARVPGWCRGEPWIGPITAVDVLAYQRDIALLASGDPLVAPIALAQPPAAATASGALRIGPAVVTGGMARLARQRTGTAAIGSNAWAVGADRSVNGKGMLVANPHFPWQGELRFWESQLTVPGKLNVYGGSLGGLPGVQIGFTDKVAWSHTIAAGARFTFYSVDLVPGAPTTYLVDGRPEAMTGKQVTIQVRTDSGALQPVTQTMWSTRYGPVLDLSFVDPSLGWTTTGAITYRDANIDNDRMLRQWFNIARAQDVAGVRDSIARDQGIPWVNTIVTDTKGNAWYADPSQTPALSAASLAEWGSNPLNLLNGSNSANTWLNLPGARSPGLIPFAQQPQLLRRDYVFNSNDSHWVVHQTQRLTGFSPLQGPEGTALSVRGRQNVRLVNGREPGTVDSHGRFSVGGLGTAILSGTNLTADEVATATVKACRQRGTEPVMVDGTPVDISAGCAALAAWDRRYELASQGAVLWRETIASITAGTPGALTEAGPLFGVAFDPADPTNTPRGAPADMMPLLTAFARAILRMRSLGFAPDVRLDAVQYTEKGTDRIPVPGSTEDVGIANLIEYTAVPGSSREPVLDGGTPVPGSDLTTKGYMVNFGTSFLLTIGYTAQGLDARCILTFSESTDPASPHFADQTRLFAQEKLRECRYAETSITSDPELIVETVRS
jgi:acyl-homoserine-lactone acylase